MTITYALIQMVEAVAEKSDKAQIITKARAHTLLMQGGSICKGLTYEKGGKNTDIFGPVILASGGFGADFTQDSLLAQYRPDLLHLSTTNGEHCTGDGIKMGEKIGAKSVDLEWVQVHPTGLVKPDDADAKIKFLAAEALRGVGGIILNKEGIRFANELGRRDYVTGEMWKNKPPFRLCLNEAAYTEIIWHCKHYTGRGVMKYYESGKALAADMGIDVQVLIDEHDQHFEAAKKTEKDPDGGSWQRIWALTSRFWLMSITSTSRLPRRPRRILMAAPGLHTLQESLGMHAAAQPEVARNSTTTSSRVLRLPPSPSTLPSS